MRDGTCESDDLVTSINGVTEDVFRTATQGKVHGAVEAEALLTPAGGVLPERQRSGAAREVLETTFGKAGRAHLRRQCGGVRELLDRFGKVAISTAGPGDHPADHREDPPRIK